jgi:hypothetical protein
VTKLGVLSVEHKEFLVVKLLKALKQRGIPFGISSFLIGALFFFPNLVLLLVYNLLDSIMFSYLILTAWLFFGPYLVYIGEALVDQLWIDLVSLIGIKEMSKLQYVERKLHSPWRSLIVIVFVIIVVILIVLLYRGEPLPFMIIYVITWIVLANYATTGFWVVLLQIEVMLKISKIPFLLNPLHRDRFGGMGFLGSMSLKITLICSTGTLMVPLAVNIGLNLFLNPIGRMVVLAIPFIFSAIIILSFLIPLLALNSAAVTAKKQMLDKAGKEYSRVFDQYEKTSTLDQGIKVLVLQGYFDETERMKEYPWDVKTALKLFIASLLPVLLSLIVNYTLHLLGIPTP